MRLKHQNSIHHSMEYFQLNRQWKQLEFSKLILYTRTNRIIKRLFSNFTFNIDPSILSRNDTVRVLCLMLLSTLATEKEAKELLNESSLSSLVDFLKRSVRNELPKEGPLWTLRRRTMAIRTLEKMITSDESVVPTFLKLNLLTLLEAALKAQNATQAEICAALTCVLTLSHNIEALQSISKDAELVKCMFKL